MNAISILYHDVVVRGQIDSSGFAGLAAARYKLDIDEFDRHLKAISITTRNAPVSVFSIIDRATTQCPLLLTFDDGGSSATVVADMLESFRWYGHFFITTDYIGTPSFVSVAQIRDLRKRGHIIGTHSCSHPIRMSRCNWKELVEEWDKSAKILSDILGEQVIIASVPGGYYSRKVAEAASSVGIRALFTSEPSTKCYFVDGCLVMGRYILRRGMAAEVAAALVSGRRPPRLKQLALWNLKKFVKSFAGSYCLKEKEMSVRNLLENGSNNK